MTQTAGGTAVAWVSPPLSAPITISGTVTMNLWAYANLVGANVTVAVSLAKYSGGSQGAAFLTSSFGTALGTSAGVCNWTGSPTSTAFAAGDRLVITGLITNATSLAMVGGDTVTMDYAGLTGGSNGDAFVALTENLSFQPEPELINFVSAYPAGGATPTSLASPSFACTAGDLIVVGVAGSDGDGEQVNQTMSDTAGNTYIAIPGSAVQIGGGNGVSTCLWYCPNAKGNSANVVTVTFTGGEYCAMCVWDISGAIGAPLDASAQGSSSVTISPQTSASFSTVASNEICCALSMTSNGGTTTTFTQGTGYLLDNGSFGYAVWCGAQHITFSSTQSGITSSMTNTGGSEGTISVATFKGAQPTYEDDRYVFPPPQFVDTTVTVW